VTDVRILTRNLTINTIVLVGFVILWIYTAGTQITQREAFMHEVDTFMHRTDRVTQADLATLRERIRGLEEEIDELRGD
jgi:hypothetical protein